MTNITRDIAAEVLALSKLYPIITILGPRQSGKTTLARMLYPAKPYVSMENPDERELAIADPRSFFQRFSAGAIIDEIQKVPDLLSYMQEIVDNKNENGLFILIGSNSGRLHGQISQSLAGRTAILKLLPFSIDELQKLKSDNITTEQYIYSGMYPRIYKHNINPTKYYRDYVNTYIEKDVRQILNIKDLRKFQLFLKLCAGRVGQIFNASNIANEVGVSHSTINEWLSVLESSFIIFLLKPYYKNFGKRVIKSPKLYFTDLGLASYLLEINTPAQVSRDPLRGGLFENLVILELLKYKLNRGMEANMYFFRDSSGNEVDLLLPEDGKLIPIEIKSAQTYSASFLKGIHKFEEISASKANKGFVIYSGHIEQIIANIELINFQQVQKIFA